MDTAPNTTSEVEFTQRTPRRFFRWTGVIILLLVVLISARSWYRNQMRESFLLRLQLSTGARFKTERVPLLKVPSFLKITLPNWFYRDVVQGIRISHESELDGKLEGIDVLDDLRYLELNRCRYTDAGIAPLAGLTNLEELCLYDSWISDTGMVHLSGLTNLKILNLSHTQISDEGLVHIKRLKNLQMLSLTDTYITDAGLAHLAGLKKLRNLYLSDNDLTDAELIHLRDLKELTILSLKNTKVSGRGLAHLKDLSNLYLFFSNKSKESQSELYLWDEIYFRNLVESKNLRVKCRYRPENYILSL